MSESFHVRGRLAGSASNFDVEHVGLGVRLQREGEEETEVLAAFGTPQVLLRSSPLTRHFTLSPKLLCR